MSLAYIALSNHAYMHPVDRKFIPNTSPILLNVSISTILWFTEQTTQAIELQIKHTNNSMGVFSVLSSAVPEQIQVLIHELDGKVKTHVLKVNKH